MTDIDDRALDSLSVAPAEDDGDGARDPRQDAGQDKSIAKRLEKNPGSEDAKLDNGLDESMDASDPPSITQPSGSGEPAPSSGYDADAEAGR
ncbi:MULTISPECIES: hypothetical protein [unclassified Sphingomonas]|uniref:hypothetical protein n=1 Tax=unclassified Sphingomonas TaxID=196159 RepID=UPI001F5AF2EE|nr:MULTISPECIES: hypothetical protein [unclassified Sphingomonas]